jgi:hypothetical protein
MPTSASGRDGSKPQTTHKEFLAVAHASDRIMFEIYREAGYGRRYRVVYFTELDEHNKEAEINAAMAGEHFYDGFIRDKDKDEAKQVIDGLLGRLNQGEEITPENVASALAEYAA